MLSAPRLLLGAALGLSACLGSSLPDAGMDSGFGEAETGAAREASSPMDAGGMRLDATRSDSSVSTPIDAPPAATDASAVADGQATDRGFGLDARPAAPTLGPVVSVDLGPGNTCAVLGDGSLWCWGDNRFVQAPDGALPFAPHPVEIVLPGTVAQVAVGYQHVCALLSSGDVYCWGELTSTTLSELVRVDLPGTVLELRSGGSLSCPIATSLFSESHACARLDDGTVYCWGSNENGQLGDGTTDVRLSAVQVVGLEDAVALDLGGRHACAIRQDRTVACWGDNRAGQLGQLPSELSMSSVPVTVPAAVDALALDLAFGRSCAVVPGGTICWGRPLPHSGACVVPMPDAPTSQPPEYAQLAVGSQHACAMTLAGTVGCWGHNDTGQLGDGSQLDRPTFGPVPDLVSPRAVRTGAIHSCAIVAEDQLACWGSNAWGMIGDGSFDDALTPTLVRR